MEVEGGGRIDEAQCMKQGRKMFKRKKELSRNVPKLWREYIQQNFLLRWRDIWVKHRTKNEAYFLWALWHQALMVNNWRTKINLGIQVDCPSCELVTPEIVTHRFWNCQRPSSYGRCLLPYCSNSRCHHT